jgi:hypothetical protein
MERFGYSNDLCQFLMAKYSFPCIPLKYSRSELTSVVGELYIRKISPAYQNITYISEILPTSKYHLHIRLLDISEYRLHIRISPTHQNTAYISEYYLHIRISLTYKKYYLHIKIPPTYRTSRRIRISPTYQNITYTSEYSIHIRISPTCQNITYI